MENTGTSKNKELLIIFTRNPRRGKVKKRLAADVGDEAALRVYQFLLEHTAKTTENLPVDKAVYYSEEVEENDCWDREIFRKEIQAGQDLGERMENAFSEGFEAGYQKIIIIGSDLFDLSEKDLKRAFSELDSADYVIGPATDGGYYLLGMKKSTPEVFRNKTWSTETVLADTLRDLKNKKVNLLEFRNDIDRLSDLQEHPELLKLLEKYDKSITGNN